MIDKSSSENKMNNVNILFNKVNDNLFKKIVFYYAIF